MNQSDFVSTLERSIRALQQVGLQYHLTGGLVSSYYGEPRLTQDIDIVVAIQQADVAKLFKVLTPEFLVDYAAIEAAVRSDRLFQGLDQETFLKVDFHVNGSIRGEFQRSVTIELFPGISVPIVSKCDAIVSKLLWVKAGSGKSREDIVGMLLDPEPIDQALLLELAEEHGVKDILGEIRKELL